MRISVFGCGYLGAVHAACMASLGHEVVGVDVLDARSRPCPPESRPSTSPASPSCCSAWTPAG